MEVRKNNPKIKEGSEIEDKPRNERRERKKY